MAGKFLAYIILEGKVGTKNHRYKLVGLFIDNTAAVSWIQRGMKNNSAAAGRLIRVLALQKQVSRASLLVVVHVAGHLNVLGNIPYCSFGYSKQWHCTNDSEFIFLINYHFLISVLGMASVFPSR